jgi:hypothetical protein
MVYGLYPKNNYFVPFRGKIIFLLVVILFLSFLYINAAKWDFVHNFITFQRSDGTYWKVHCRRDFWPRRIFPYDRLSTSPSPKRPNLQIHPEAKKNKQKSKITTRSFHVVTFSFLIEFIFEDNMIQINAYNQGIFLFLKGHSQRWFYFTTTIIVTGRVKRCLHYCVNRASYGVY